MVPRWLVASIGLRLSDIKAERAEVDAKDIDDWGLSREVPVNVKKKVKLRKLRIRWTCRSGKGNHTHKWHSTAWLCGRIQYYAIKVVCLCRLLISCLRKGN